MGVCARPPVGCAASKTVSNIWGFVFPACRRTYTMLEDSGRLYVVQVFPARIPGVYRGYTVSYRAPFCAWRARPYGSKTSG